MNLSPRVGSPEVSVLMSCYNASRWLKEAVESVLSQTFENFEFILVDDGSTDETWKIIQSYQERDNRLVCLRKKNTGLSDSLNVGIAQARGTWIARLDADDLCEPDRLEEQVDFMRKHSEVVLLGSGFVEIDEQGRFIKKQRYPSGHRRLVRHLLRLQRFFPHSSAIYRAESVRTVKGYNLRTPSAEDCRLWLELISQGQIACLPRNLVRVRKHSSQMSLDDNGRRQLGIGTAAVVCHRLRMAHYEDPSTCSSEDQWFAFLSWLEGKIDESGAFQRRKAWADARADFFAKKNKLNGGLSFMKRLLQSPQAGVLVYEKFFGTSLAKRWARDWMRIGKPASGGRAI